MEKCRGERVIENMQMKVFQIANAIIEVTQVIARKRLRGTQEEAEDQGARIGYAFGKVIRDMLDINRL